MKLIILIPLLILSVIGVAAIVFIFWVWIIGKRIMQEDRFRQ